MSDAALPRAPDRDGQRGAALVIVLLFAALLAGLTAVALRGATSGARAAAVFLDEMRADELGRAAADALASQIMNGGPADKRGGAFSIRLAQAEVEVDYRSESARVDLNKGPVDLIVGVLAAAGADADAAASIRTRLLAARAGPAASPAPPATDAFGNATPRPISLVPFPPVATALIEDPRQAVGGWNLPDDVVARALTALTVANGTGTVDPVLADRLVLTALLGDAARVDDYIDRRREGFVDTGSALALLPVPAQEFASFADVSAVRAEVLVTVAKRFRRRYEIVLDPPAFAGQAPNVLSWRPLF